MTTELEGHVQTARECPRCGRITSFYVPDRARSHVICPCCGTRFEIDTLGPRQGGGRGKVGSPVNPKGAFKYLPAASHADASQLRRRLKQYAKLPMWSPLCEG